MASPDSTPTATVSGPIVIYKLAHRYLIYDVNVVTHLRQQYNVCGVLIGSLPQASQQNVFLGLPLELMPEEARLLVERGVAYVVDDVTSHKRHFLSSALSAEERKAYLETLRRQGQGAAREAVKRSDDRKRAALKKLDQENWNDIPDDMFRPSPRPGRRRAEPKQTPAPGTFKVDEDDLLFPVSSGSGSPEPGQVRRFAKSTPAEPEPYGVNPTTSYPPLQTGQSSTGSDPTLIEVPRSYPLYRALNTTGYFLAPGLRFGCQYMAYPGDPLRFHSHFLCKGLGWDEEFDVMELVGGGRLSTGVKKALVFGGEEQRDDGEDSVRTFAIEWAGM